jgi:hypothetical protein
MSSVAKQGSTYTKLEAAPSRVSNPPEFPDLKMETDLVFEC